jgi:hypothetical protein
MTKLLITAAATATVAAAAFAYKNFEQARTFIIEQQAFIDEAYLSTWRNYRERKTEVIQLELRIAQLQLQVGQLQETVDELKKPAPKPTAPKRPATPRAPKPTAPKQPTTPAEGEVKVPKPRAPRKKVTPADSTTPTEASN